MNLAALINVLASGDDKTPESSSPWSDNTMVRTLSAFLLIAIIGASAGRVSAQVNVAQGVADRLRDGTILVQDAPYPGTDVRWGRATALVEQRPDIVLRIITDYARYAEFMPHFHVSRVLSQRGTQALVYFEARVIRDTTTLWSQMRIRPQANVGTTQVFEATMERGNVERMAARWELTPVDNGTHCLVTFQFMIEPDVPFPDSVITDQNLRAARRAMFSLNLRATTVPEFTRMAATPPATPATAPAQAAAPAAATSAPQTAPASPTRTSSTPQRPASLPSGQANGLGSLGASGS